MKKKFCPHIIHQSACLGGCWFSLAYFARTLHNLCLLNGLIIHLIPTSLLFVFTLLFASVCFLSVKDLINGICIYICLFMFHIYFLFSLEMEHNFKQHNGCVTLWPCHLHYKVSQGKRRIMKIQIISPYKNIIFKQIL